MTQTTTNKLQIIIDEFKNITPEITNTIIFNKNGDVIASTQVADENQTKKLIASFKGIADQSEGIGEVEILTIQGANSQLNITSVNNFFLANVSSRAADQKSFKALTRVILPTVVSLMDQASFGLLENKAIQTLQPQEKPMEEAVFPVEPVEEPVQNEPCYESPMPFSSEPFLPEAPVNQFMIEKIAGLLVSADTVRVDSEVIAKWSDLYGDKQITQVKIETLEGKKTICKFKPLKEANHNGQGIIQVPEKILQTLQTSKGKLVMVRPVIE